MKHTYHVFTPVSREKNLRLLIDMLAQQAILWHPIFDSDSHLAWIPPAQEWITPMVCPTPPPAGFTPGAHPVNWFLEHAEWQDDHRYINLNDDDFYEPGFFEKMDAHEGEVLICSMKRGDCSPPKPDTPSQPCNTLLAQKENLFCGGVGGEQIMMTGRIYRNCRIGPGYCNDWDMMAKVLAEHEPVFVPEAFVWFNYLEPGRWKEGPNV